jgi:hypothetical protein
MIFTSLKLLNVGDYVFTVDDNTGDDRIISITSKEVTLVTRYGGEYTITNDEEAAYIIRKSEPWE